MKAICLYFQVHQPFRLRTFRFFEIAHNQPYFDKVSNSEILRKVAEKCYLPTNQILYDLIKKHQGKFKVTFSISGSALEQFQRYAPEVLSSFQRLVSTGCVELLAETYHHSLAALVSEKEFKSQVREHVQKIKSVFGVEPKVFRNTELIYNNEIGAIVADLGFNAMLTEGSQQVLKEKSPNYLYNSISSPHLGLLLRNYPLSDDISFRFSDRSWKGWPLTPEKYVGWLKAMPQEQQIINLFMDYETFGEHQWSESGIFDFLKNLPQEVFTKSSFTFTTPSEVVKELKPIAALDVPHAISWADEAKDLSAWLGNELQKDAFKALYKLKKKVRRCMDPKIQSDWKFLQTSDHFYYMCTKKFADGDVHNYFNPYASPYLAFINYMNIVSDLEIRVHKQLRNNALTDGSRILEKLAIDDEVALQVGNY